MYYNRAIKEIPALSKSMIKENPQEAAEVILGAVSDYLKSLNTNFGRMTFYEQVDAVAGRFGNAANVFKNLMLPEGDTRAEAVLMEAVIENKVKTPAYHSDNMVYHSIRDAVGLLKHRRYLEMVMISTGGAITTNAPYLYACKEINSRVGKQIVGTEISLENAIARLRSNTNEYSILEMVRDALVREFAIMTLEGVDIPKAWTQLKEADIADAVNKAFMNLESIKYLDTLKFNELTLFNLVNDCVRLCVMKATKSHTMPNVLFSGKVKNM